MTTSFSLRQAGKRIPFFSPQKRTHSIQSRVGLDGVQKECEEGKRAIGTRKRYTHIQYTRIFRVSAEARIHFFLSDRKYKWERKSRTARQADENRDLHTGSEKGPYACFATS